VEWGGGGGDERLESVHVGAPAADVAGGHFFALAGGEGLVCDGVAMDGVDEGDVDVREGACKDQGVAVVGPLWEIDGEDLLELAAQSVNMRGTGGLYNQVANLHRGWSSRYLR